MDWKNCKHTTMIILGSIHFHSTMKKLPPPPLLIHILNRDAKNSSLEDFVCFSSVYQQHEYG